MTHATRKLNQPNIILCGRLVVHGPRRRQGGGGRSNQASECQSISPIIECQSISPTHHLEASHQATHPRGGPHGAQEALASRPARMHPLLALALAWAACPTAAAARACGAAGPSSCPRMRCPWTRYLGAALAALSAWGGEVGGQLVELSQLFRC